MLLDHTYTFKPQQPGGRSGEEIDLAAAGQTYAGGRNPELNDDAVTAADGTGRGGGIAAGGPCRSPWTT